MFCILIFQYDYIILVYCSYMFCIYPGWCINVYISFRKSFISAKLSSLTILWAFSSSSIHKCYICHKYAIGYGTLSMDIFPYPDKHHGISFISYDYCQYRYSLTYYSPLLTLFYYDSPPHSLIITFYSAVSTPPTHPPRLTPAHHHRHSAVPHIHPSSHNPPYSTTPFYPF